MKALIVVDAQYDFMPASDEYYEAGQGGALAVPDGDQIVPVINKLLPDYELVIFTQDWHPEKMEAFASSHENKKPFDTYKTKKGKEDTLWPDHCIAESYGAQLHEDIDFSKIKGDFYIFKKGTEKDKHPYSGFDGTGLGFFLREKDIKEVDVVGLALDYCVKDTAMDAVDLGFKTTVMFNGCKGIAEDLTNTILELSKNKVNVNFTYGA